MDGQALKDPYDNNGGSFTGPSLSPSGDMDWEIGMNELVSDYLRALDALPHHFQLHFMHACEILGYKHPTTRTQDWWRGTYYRLVNDMHLTPETVQELDHRLSDNRENWLSHNDNATVN